MADASIFNLSPPLPSSNPPSSSSHLLSPHPLASRSDSAPGINGQSCWPTTPMKRPVRIGVAMGPCKNCHCGHPMQDHQDYSADQPPTTLIPAHIKGPPVPPAQIFEPPAIGFPVIRRTELVQEIFQRLDDFGILRINGTPASGKSTLMTLLIRELCRRAEPERKQSIYLLIGWEHGDVRSAGGWAQYLETQTGINGFNWVGNPGYLFIDEAQQTYFDTELWAGLFKAVSQSSRCRIILFTSYGSPNKGLEGFDERFQKTPMIFDASQQISLREDTTVLPEYLPVGLLLTEKESMELVGECMKGRLSSIFTGAVTEDFKRGVWQVTQGHAGLITSFCDVLGRWKNLRPYKNSDLHWKAITDIVFKDPVGLFKRISGSQFSRGLPRSETLQNPLVAKVLKKAVLSNHGLVKSSFSDGSPESQALYHIWRNGWLHAQRTGNDTQYVFATEFHKWFCACVFTPPPGNEQQLPYLNPLQLAKDVVRRFNPCQLSDPERAMNRDILPLEDQYGKEFYRCIDDVLNGRMVVSPEFAVSYGTQNGCLDFFIPDMAWGIELLRENDRIAEHLARFSSGGQYYPLVEDRKMDQWIVLNFTNKRPSKKRTEYIGRLYHVLFTTGDFPSVEILGADLELESAFSLLKNNSHLFL